jgi:hypothetical protein
MCNNVVFFIIGQCSKIYAQVHCLLREAVQETGVRAAAYHPHGTGQWEHPHPPALHARYPGTALPQTPGARKVFD